MSRERRVTTCSEVPAEISSEISTFVEPAQQIDQALSAKTLETGSDISPKGSPKGSPEITGLLAEAYTSHNYLSQERQSVFSRHWVCAGFASDVPNVGDVHPTEIAGMPIVLVRAGRTGEDALNQAAPL